MVMEGGTSTKTVTMSGGGGGGGGSVVMEKVCEAVYAGYRGQGEEIMNETKVSLYWIKVMRKRQNSLGVAKTSEAGLMAYIM